MPLPIVLAIEPDRRQAAHVSAVVRHRVGAELILADTTEGALDAIGSRVPDLVLVPALLSPQDDAALAAALRVIAAAAHVHTLTIPVFSNGVSHGDGGGGLLARFRRGKSEGPSVGCDPAVFAEQISDYLREAAAERADLDAPVPHHEPAPAPIVEESPFIESSFIESPVFEPTPEPVRLIAPVVFTPPPAPPPALDFAEAATAEFGERAFVEPYAGAQAPAADVLGDETNENEIVIDLSDEIVEISPETPSVAAATDDELFDGEQFGVYTLSLDETLETPEEAVGTLMGGASSGARDADVLREFGAAETDASAQAPMGEPAASKPVDTSAWLALGLRSTRPWPAIEGAIVENGPTLGDLVAAGAGRPAAAAPKAPEPAAKAEHLDWAELVASLRQDMERRRKQPAAPAPIPIAPPPPRPAETPQRPQLHGIDGAARRSRKATPAQDEWGFFDPQQCGFAALLAKLDEFSDADEPDIRRTS